MDIFNDNAINKTKWLSILANLIDIWDRNNNEYKYDFIAFIEFKEYHLKLGM